MLLHLKSALSLWLWGNLFNCFLIAFKTHASFWLFFMKIQFQGLKAEKRLAFFSLADSRWVPSSHLLMILAKLLPNCQPLGPPYPKQRRPRAESTSQTATHLDKLETALPGCFSFFQGTRDNSPVLSWQCSHTLAGQTTAVDPIVNSTGAKRGVCRWFVLVKNYF